MKSFQKLLFSTAFAALVSVGCEPRPVVQEERTEQPAAEVEVNHDGVEVERETPDDAAVDVQVGGGQGIQVEVERESETTTSPAK